MFNDSFYAQVAQLVEQATENRCVGGSIPPLGTTFTPDIYTHSKRVEIHICVGSQT